MSNTEQNDTKNEQKKTASPVLTVVLSVLILAGAAGVTALIFLNEPTAQRSGATKQTAMLVEIVEVQRGSFRPVISGLGPVQPAREVVLSPRISGRVLDVDDAFEPGGVVNAGQLLVTLDPADYEIIIRQRRSALQQARADLDIEMGRQDVARQEFALIEQEVSEKNKELVLRKPQLAAAKAAVRSARAALDQAKLELDRTTIQAPFDAQIITRAVSSGSQVSPSSVLGRLIGTDEYWVIATVPLPALQQIDFPEAGREGSLVQLRNRSAWPRGVTRQGRVARLIGALDDNTRLARVVITVKDPLARKSNDMPPLIVGSMLQAEITGKELEDVFRIRRDLVRQGDTVWLMRDGKLAIEPVTVVFRDRNYAYISQGLKNGDKAVITNLATIAPGSPLRTEANETATGAAGTSGENDQ